MFLLSFCGAIATVSALRSLALALALAVAFGGTAWPAENVALVAYKSLILTISWPPVFVCLRLISNSHEKWCVRAPVHGSLIYYQK